MVALMVLPSMLSNAFRFLSGRRPTIQGRAVLVGTDVRKLLQKHFDPIFFRATYGETISGLKECRSNELINVYLNEAAARRLDPYKGFSEADYLELHPDIQLAVEKGEFVCGFHHWLTHGSKEGRQTKKLSYVTEPRDNSRHRNEAVFLDIPQMRWEQHFDKRWYSEWLKEHFGIKIHAEKLLEFFLKNGLWEGHVPTQAFDENFYLTYYEDVREAKEQGVIPSGYAHFILNGEKEGRLPVHDLKKCLRNKLGPLAEPISLQNEPALAQKFRSLPLKMDSSREPALNVFVSSLDPDIMFGGYIAFLHFLYHVAQQGFRLRFIVTGDGQSNRDWFLNNIREKWSGVFSSAEFLNISREELPLIEYSPRDLCIAYSAWDAYAANELAQTTDVKKFLYFIQEDERIFHDNNSLNFLVSGAYVLNHAAIFNSTGLEKHFRDLNLGVFSSERDSSKYITFEHVIPKFRPSRKAMENKPSKKLFVYCRPEGHAGRNLFEISIMVLRRCVERRILDSSWELIGLGSMGYEGEVDLGSDVNLIIRKRVEQSVYQSLLTSFDVGLSLMWAPHPGVTPYELAGAGVVCVTNTYGYRDKAYFEAFGYNMVATEPSIDALSEGIREAVHRSDDFDERIKSAEMPFPSNWDDVFTPTFVKKALSLIVDE